LGSSRIEAPQFEAAVQAGHIHCLRMFGSVIYENLKYDCNQPNVLSSSIDSRDVEVTIADITVTLKCNTEQSEVDDQWIACPSMLTTEDILSDMCEGQFADRHKNAATKSKLPPQLWFVDFVL
jgi:hypothetical protein